MKWIIFVLVMVISILMVICYALLVMIQDEEESKRIQKAWRNSDDE